jgi:hypothetical protein
MVLPGTCPHTCCQSHAWSAHELKARRCPGSNAGGWSHRSIHLLLRLIERPPGSRQEGAGRGEQPCTWSWVGLLGWIH